MPERSTSAEAPVPRRRPAPVRRRKSELSVSAPSTSWNRPPARLALAPPSSVKRLVVRRVVGSRERSGADPVLDKTAEPESWMSCWAMERELLAAARIGPASESLWLPERLYRLPGLLTVWPL